MKNQKESRIVNKKIKGITRLFSFNGKFSSELKFIVPWVLLEPSKLKNNKIVYKH